MAYTEAQKRATEKYIKEKTDRIRIYVPIGTKDRWKDYAVKNGYPNMTQFIVSVIEEKIQKG